MSSLAHFLMGTKVAEVRTSKFNGEIQVIKSIAFGTYLQVGGLTQSGGVVIDVWRTSIKKVKSFKKRVKKCLVVGFGGGSAARLVNKYWPEAQIVGVDIDQEMVDLGKKYLKLDKIGAEVVVGDGVAFVKKLAGKNSQFDLVLVDTYAGDEFPAKFESDEFLRLIKKVLPKDGVVVFNRLYYGEKRPLAVKFGTKLKKYFSEVLWVYPEANVMFVCKK